jgi:hypothetical protein
MSKRCAADNYGFLETSQGGGVQAWEKLSGSGRLKRKTMATDEQG